MDTSGAYIPGHGTPTVIIVGRNGGTRARNHDPRRSWHPWWAGEPGDAAKGLVWQAIVNQVEESRQRERVGEHY